MGSTPRPGTSPKPRTDISGSKIGKTGNEVITSLLDRLDALDDGSMRNRRSSQRCLFRRQDVTVRVHHPGGSTAQRHVVTRNLSASGVAFLYPSFLHSGTRCEIGLTRRLGGADTIQGKVVFCAHVGGVFHQVGVKFDQKVFHKLYLDPGAYDEVEGEAPTDTQSITGRVLYLDDQEMDQVLLQHHLRTTGIQLESASDLKRAIEKLSTGSFDLLLCDLNLRDCTGEEAVRAIRQANFKGPICLVTAETATARLKSAQTAGASGVLSKPYEPGKLLAMISAWLKGGTQEPIRSEVASTPQMAAILERYVKSMHEAAVELQRLSESDSLDRVRQICMTIKGSGGGFGFPQLSDAARDAAKSLDATCSVSESALELQRLIDLCRRVTAEPQG